MAAYLDHRALAAKHRADAAQEPLANRREMHERSAKTFDEMAQNLEDTIGLAKVNALAKARLKLMPVD
jgi:hypothetical protein